MKSLFSFSLALSLGLTAISVQAIAQEQKQPTKQQDSGSPVFQILEKVLTPLEQAEDRGDTSEIPTMPTTYCNIRSVMQSPLSLVVYCSEPNAQGINTFVFPTDDTASNLNTEHIWDMIQKAMSDENLVVRMRYIRDRTPDVRYCGGMNSEAAQLYCRRPRDVILQRIR